MRIRTVFVVTMISLGILLQVGVPLHESAFADSRAGTPTHNCTIVTLRCGDIGNNCGTKGKANCGGACNSCTNRGTSWSGKKPGGSTVDEAGTVDCGTDTTGGRCIWEGIPFTEKGACYCDGAQDYVPPQTVTCGVQQNYTVISTP